MKASKFLTSVLALALSTGCGDVIKNALESALSATETAALESAESAATASGGVAVLLTPGEAASVSVSDTSSPISGTTVDLPGGAIPASAENPILTIVPGDDLTVTSHTAVGPTVSITLTELVGGADIELAADASVSVPATAATADVQLGHLDDEGVLTVIAGAVLADGLIRGDTGSFSEFVAVVDGEAGGDGDGDGDGNGLSPHPGPCEQLMLDDQDNITGRTTYTYDADGNKIGAETDNGDDGTVDTVVSYEYDAQGNLTLQETDTGNDGSIDYASSYAYTYDNDGNILTKESDWTDDGTVDAKDTYVYDSDGKLIEVQMDQNNDGTVDNSEEYEYDGDGNHVRTIRYDGGTAWGYIVYEYDENGLKTAQEYQDSGETTTQRDEFTYDENGNLITEVENVGTISGGQESPREYTYDCWN